MNNSRNLIRLLVVGTCLAVSACSSTMAPVAIRDSAASLHQGEFQIDTAILPLPTVGVAYGVTEKVDVGLDLENLPSLWLRYTVQQENPGFTAAFTGGAFKGELDTDSYSYQNNTQLQGIYLGGIAEYASSDKLNFTLAYRYNYVDYDDFVLDNVSSGWLGTDPYFFNSSRAIAVSSRDFRGVGQLSLHATFELRSHLFVHLGGACQINHTRQKNQIPSHQCAPYLSLSFMRR